MISTIHRGHVEFGESELGATLTLESGRVLLDIASTNQTHKFDERLKVIRFKSNTGYFTLIDLFRLKYSMTLGVAGLATYHVRLAFESAHFQTEEEIRSTRWSMIVGDIAKILHVNGVTQDITTCEAGRIILTYTVVPPSAMVLACPSARLTLLFGQNIKSGGDIINGPKLTLTYPIDLVFAQEVSIEIATRTMHRVRQVLSLVMGRVLPITSASVEMPGTNNPHQVAIHGLVSTDAADQPTEPVLQGITPEMLAAVIDRWLSRYDELDDAIDLHLSGLEQRRLPSELRFQIFVQSLEALHRRISPPPAEAIDIAPILEILRERGIAGDVVDRVNGVLAHAHEPGLRQRLKDYWSRFETEINTLRPAEKRKIFIGRITATRNHYAHRTNLNEQVLTGKDLWNATETVKAISHMALLSEVGANTAGIGQEMLNSRFAEYALRE